MFSKLYTQPSYTPVYASLNASRRLVQNSGPSRSLILSRETLTFSTSCRFIPAHRTYTSKLSILLGVRNGNGSPGWPGSRFPEYGGNEGDQLGFVPGFLAAGFRTGFFGAPLSFGMSSSFTLAFSQCRKNAGSGS